MVSLSVRTRLIPGARAKPPAAVECLCLLRRPVTGLVLSQGCPRGSGGESKDRNGAETSGRAKPGDQESMETQKSRAQRYARDSWGDTREKGGTAQ